MKLQHTFFILGALLILTPLLYSIYSSIPGYGERTGVVIGILPTELGYNIFFNDNKTLFLAGQDWKFTNFLRNLTLYKTYTFKYYIETYTYNDPLSSSLSVSFKHIIAVLDENGTILYKDNSYQKWRIEITNLPPFSLFLLETGFILIFLGFLIEDKKR